MERSFGGVILKLVQFLVYHIAQAGVRVVIDILASEHVHAEIEGDLPCGIDQRKRARGAVPAEFSHRGERGGDGCVHVGSAAKSPAVAVKTGGHKVGTRRVGKAVDTHGDDRLGAQDERAVGRGTSVCQRGQQPCHA